MSSEKEKFDEKPFEKPADEGRTEGEVAEIVRCPRRRPRAERRFPLRVR